MNVVILDPHAKANNERKEELVEVVNEIRRLIEEGEIKELVACSMDKDGISNIHVSALDLAGGVGLFEIGKHLLIQTEA